MVWCTSHCKRAWQGAQAHETARQLALSTARCALGHETTGGKWASTLRKNLRPKRGHRAHLRSVCRQLNEVLREQRDLLKLQ